MNSNIEILQGLDSSQIIFVKQNLELYQDSPVAFFRTLIMKGIQNNEIIQQLDPNYEPLIEYLIREKSWKLLETLIINNKFTDKFSKLTFHLIFCGNLKLWKKLSTLELDNLDYILHNKITQDSFEFLLNKYNLMTPNYYYFIWKYNPNFINLLVKNIDISFFYNFSQYENPIRDNNLEYLNFLCGKLRNMKFLEESVAHIFKILCECDSTYPIWNFYINLTEKITQFVDILSLKNYNIKVLVIDKYLEFYTKDMLYNLLLIQIEIGSYITENDIYLQNSVNIYDCINIFKKYFKGIKYEKEQFIGKDGDKIKKYYGEYIYNSLKNS